jgi:peptidyl-prolyl cis-trans isomerase A (cyclophilin A)
MRIICTLFILVTLLCCNNNANDNPHIQIVTSLGDIEVELFPKQAPKTVAAFLQNIDAGLYKNTNFYRVLKNEDLNADDNYGIIQGGIWPAAKTVTAIPLESTNATGLTHISGTISMARTSGAQATSEFFICIGEQKVFDQGGDLPEDKLGFAAFGKVVSGMNVVRKIQDQKNNGDKFVQNITIEKVEKL